MNILLKFLPASIRSKILHLKTKRGKSRLSTSLYRQVYGQQDGLISFSTRDEQFLFIGKRVLILSDSEWRFFALNWEEVTVFKI